MKKINNQKGFDKMTEIKEIKEEKTLWIQDLTICSTHEFNESEQLRLKEAIESTINSFLKNDENLRYVDFDSQHQESGQVLRWFLEWKNNKK